MEINKDLLLVLVSPVFITTSRLVSTSIALHAPLILKNVHFYLRKTWKTSAINRTFTIYQQPTAQYLHFRKYCVVGSWEIEKDVLLALVFNLFFLQVHVLYEHQ